MKTILSPTYHMKHALALITALTLVATNSAFADKAPNLDDPKVREKILKEAVEHESLQRIILKKAVEHEIIPRSRLALFQKGAAKPYTGWVRVTSHSERRIYLGLMQYRDGIREGLTVQWYDNGKGKKSWEVTYKDGEKEGMEIRWHDNGQKKQEGAYKDGEGVGQWIRWDKDGVKLKSVSVPTGKFRDAPSRRRYVPKPPKPSSEEGKKKRNIPKAPAPEVRDVPKPKPTGKARSRYVPKPPKPSSKLPRLKNVEEINE